MTRTIVKQYTRWRWRVGRMDKTQVAVGYGEYIQVYVRVSTDWHSYSIVSSCILKTAFSSINITYCGFLSAFPTF